MVNKPFGLAVNAIIRNDGGRILVLQRSVSSKHFAGKWECPGGKVDGGESFDAALLREVDEETGLDISLSRVASAVHYETAAIRLAVLFVEARLVSGQVRLSDEHKDYRWVTFHDLAALDMSEPLRAFVLEYVNRTQQ